MASEINCLIEKSCLDSLCIYSLDQKHNSLKSLSICLIIYWCSKWIESEYRERTTDLALNEL